MKQAFYKEIFTMALLLLAGILSAQEKEVLKEKRCYDYCDNITASSNQLYRMVVAGEKGRYATWKDILVMDSRPATAISLSPSGSHFAIATDKMLIELWSLETRDLLLGKLKGHTGVIRVLNYSKDAKYLLSAGADGNIKIWDVKEQVLYKNMVNKAPVNAACFSPNGYFIATDKGKDIVIRNFSKDKVVQTLNGHQLALKKLKFSDDGLYLLSYDTGNNVIVWKTSDWSKYREMKMPVIIRDIDMHHNNKYLVTVDSKGQLMMWNLKKGELMQTLKGKNPANTVTFSYDYSKQESLLTHTDTKVCYIWDIVHLDPAFDILLHAALDEKMELWTRKGKEESSEAYELRVNDSTLLTRQSELEREIVTELGLKWRPIGKPELGAYDKDTMGYMVEFPELAPFVLKIEEEEAIAFRENIGRYEFLNPVYALNDSDEFYLNYLEIKDPVQNKTYYYDNIGKRQPEKKEVKLVSGEIIKKVGEEEAVLRQKLMDFFEKEMAEQRISDNVKVNVDAKAKESLGEDGTPVVDYHVKYSYEVLKSDKKNIGDWAPGRYLLEESNAAKSSVEVIRQTFEGELAKYISTGKNITVRVTGSADGSPIVKAIPYGGKYGDFNGEPYYLNGNLDNISISAKEGVAANNQLAYLRTYGVRYFIEHEIGVLKNTRNAFEHYVNVAEERGDEFRRVSIEIIIHDAFGK